MLVKLPLLGMESVHSSWKSACGASCKCVYRVEWWRHCQCSLSECVHACVHACMCMHVCDVHMYMLSGLCFQGAVLSFPLSWSEITDRSLMTSLFPLWAKKDIPQSILFKVCFEEPMREVDGSWEKSRNKLQLLPSCPGADSFLGGGAVPSRRHWWVGR